MTVFVVIIPRSVPSPLRPANYATAQQRASYYERLRQAWASVT